MSDQGGRPLTRRGLLWGGAAAGAAAAVYGAFAVAGMTGGDGGSATGGAGGSTGGGDASPGGAALPDFRPRFGADGLVTNEWAYRNPGGAGARLSPDWVATSGSLFATGGLGWTGLPDAGETGADSGSANDSAVFRLVSRRRDFDAVAVSCKVRLLAPITTRRTPAEDWDGAHIWLRYHSPQELYAVSFRRRDGSVVIKRKIPAHDATAANGGDYATVAEGKHAISYGDWHRVEASAVNVADGVRLRLAVDGTEVLHTVDRFPGPLTTAGGVGLRVDNSELWFTDYWARKP